MTCDQWDVVIVPFPFTEKAGTKRRPALVLTKKNFNAHGHTMLLMITTTAHRSWPGDAAMEDYRTAGLRTPCMVRLKAFTLDNRLIMKKIGELSTADRHKISAHIQQFIL